MAELGQAPGYLVDTLYYPPGCWHTRGWHALEVLRPERSVVQEALVSHREIQHLKQHLQVTSL